MGVMATRGAGRAGWGGDVGPVRTAGRPWRGGGGKGQGGSAAAAGRGCSTSP